MRVHFAELTHPTAFHLVGVSSLRYGRECWAAGNAGERGILAKKEAREREEKKFARCASIIPGGAGGVLRWKDTAFGGIELQKNWAPLGTHVEPSIFA